VPTPAPRHDDDIDNTDKGKFNNDGNRRDPSDRASASTTVPSTLTSIDDAATAGADGKNGSERASSAAERDGANLTPPSPMPPASLRPPTHNDNDNKGEGAGSSMAGSSGAGDSQSSPPPPSPPPLPAPTPLPPPTPVPEHDRLPGNDEPHANSYDDSSDHMPLSPQPMPAPPVPTAALRHHSGAFNAQARSSTRTQKLELMVGIATVVMIVIAWQRWRRQQEFAAQQPRELALPTFDSFAFDGQEVDDDGDASQNDDDDGFAKFGGEGDFEMPAFDVDGGGGGLSGAPSGGGSTTPPTPLIKKVSRGMAKTNTHEPLPVDDSEDFFL
jgi:hypothetical protein